MSFTWQGASGTWYEFDVARTKRAWEPVGGIYMFVKPGDMPTMEAGGPICLFLGSTNSLADALARHDQWNPAQTLGAAEIHLLVCTDAYQRVKIEQDILKAQRPILNRLTQRAA